MEQRGSWNGLAIIVILFAVVLVLMVGMARG